jgi:hypothetical protein
MWISRKELTALHSQIGQLAAEVAALREDKYARSLKESGDYEISRLNWRARDTLALLMEYLGLEVQHGAEKIVKRKKAA